MIVLCNVDNRSEIQLNNFIVQVWSVITQTNVDQNPCGLTAVENNSIDNKSLHFIETTRSITSNNNSISNMATLGIDALCTPPSHGVEQVSHSDLGNGLPFLLECCP